MGKIRFYLRAFLVSFLYSLICFIITLSAGNSFALFLLVLYFEIQKSENYGRTTKNTKETASISGNSGNIDAGGWNSGWTPAVQSTDE